MSTAMAAAPCPQAHFGPMDGCTRPGPAAPRLRLWAAHLAAALACLLPAQAPAQPEGPLRILVPYGAGSGVDIQARVLAEKLRPILNQPVVVINKAGAGGIVGVQDVLAAPRDGSMALWAAGSLFGTNPFVFRRLPYSLEQFEPVSNVVELCLVFSARAGLGVKNIQQLVARMKAEPGKVGFASPGIGNQPVLTWEKFVRHTGTQALNVPYKTTSDVTMGILTGQADVTVGVVLGSDLENFRAGKTVPLAVTCRERMAPLPEVQTMAEAGYPEFTIYGTMEMFYAKGVPAAAIDRLAKAIEQVKRDPDYLRQLDAQHARPAPQSTPAEFRAWLDADRALWSRIAREANVVIDN